jgi:hypothetical protein
MSQQNLYDDSYGSRPMRTGSINETIPIEDHPDQYAKLSTWRMRGVLED